MVLIMVETTPNSLASADNLRRVKAHLALLQQVLQSEFAEDKMRYDKPSEYSITINQMLIDSLMMDTLESRAEAARDISELLSLPVNVDGVECRAWVEKSSEPGKVDLYITPTIKDYKLGTQIYKYSKSFDAGKNGESMIPNLENRKSAIAGFGDKKDVLGTELFDIYYDQVDELYDKLREIQQLIPLIGWMPNIIKSELLADIDDVLPNLEKFFKRDGIINNKFYPTVRFTKEGCGLLYEQISKSKQIIDYIARYRMKTEYSKALSVVGGKCQATLSSLEEIMPNIKVLQFNKPAAYELIDVPLFSNDYSFDVAINGEEFAPLDLNEARDMALATRKNLCAYAKKVITDESSEESLKFRKLLAAEILSYAVANKHAALELFQSAFDYQIKKAINQNIPDFVPTAAQCVAFIDDFYAEGAPIHMDALGMIEIAANYCKSVIMVHDSDGAIIYSTSNQAESKPIHIAFNKYNLAHQFQALIMPQAELRQVANNSAKKTPSASLRHLNAGTGRYWSLTIRRIFADIADFFKVLASYVMINPFSKGNSAAKYEREAKEMLVEKVNPNDRQIQYDSDTDSEYDDNESEYDSDLGIDHEDLSLESESLSSEESDHLEHKSSNKKHFHPLTPIKSLLYRRDPSLSFNEVKIDDTRKGNQTKMVLVLLRNYFIAQATKFARDDERTAELTETYNRIIEPLLYKEPDYYQFHENIRSAALDGDLQIDDYIKDILRVEFKTESGRNRPSLQE